jgi:hypothetical protein
MFDSAPESKRLGTLQRAALAVFMAGPGRALDSLEVAQLMLCESSPSAAHCRT